MIKAKDDHIYLLLYITLCPTTLGFISLLLLLSIFIFLFLLFIFKIYGMRISNWNLFSQFPKGKNKMKLFFSDLCPF